MKLSNILRAISESLFLRETRENPQELLLRYRINGQSFDRKKLIEGLNLINPRDRFSISISHEGSDETTSLHEKTQEAIDTFFSKLKLWEETAGLSGEITLRVSKSVHNRTITMYSLDKFFEYLCEDNIVGTINKISSLAEVAYCIECEELTQEFKTHLFVLKPPPSSPIFATNPEPPTRSKRLELREKICAIYGNTYNSFLPNDFRFNSRFPHKNLREIFEKLELVHALISLSDTTKFEASGKLSILMKGYSNVKLEIDSLKKVDISSKNDFFEIFEWTYTDGNIVDKAGICRNLISIHLVDDNLLKLKPGCIESIKSNYIIYLKENLKQYIDVKNKLSEQIQKISEKATDVVKSINSYLRGSIFSVFTFVFSVFIIRTLGKSDSSPMFSDTIYMLFILFIAISILVLIYAITETNAEIKRFKNSYKFLRERYSDLITKEDLNRILSQDADFNRELKYIRKSRKKVVILWIASLAMIFTVITTIKLMQLTPDSSNQVQALDKRNIEPATTPALTTSSSVPTPTLHEDK